MIGKEIIDKHNATGISDGDNAEESRKRQTISKTITTTVTTAQPADDLAAGNVEAFQITPNTQLNNLSSVNDISADDYVEISYMNENGQNVAASITKTTVPAKNL